MDPQDCLHICPHCNKCLVVRVLVGTPLTKTVTCGICGKKSNLFARPVQMGQSSSQPPQEMGQSSSQPPQAQLDAQRREMDLHPPESILFSRSR